MSFTISSSVLSGITNTTIEIPVMEQFSGSISAVAASIPCAFSPINAADTSILVAKDDSFMIKNIMVTLDEFDTGNTTETLDLTDINSMFRVEYVDDLKAVTSSSNGTVYFNKTVKESVLLTAGVTSFSLIADITKQTLEQDANTGVISIPCVAGSDCYTASNFKAGVGVVITVVSCKSAQLSDTIAGLINPIKCLPNMPSFTAISNFFKK